MGSRDTLAHSMTISWISYFFHLRRMTAALVTVMQQTWASRLKTQKFLSGLGKAVVPLALWGQVHGLLFLSPVQGVYERVQASAGRENGQRVYVRDH